MEKKETSQNHLSDSVLNFLLPVLLLVAIVWLLRHFFNSGETRKKPGRTRIRKQPYLFPKQILLAIYGINKRTMSKWVSIFCKPGACDFGRYQNARSLPLLQIRHIVEQLGDPEIFPVLRKAKLAERCKSDYPTLRGCIRNNPERFGISAEDFAALSRFPPRAGQRIVEKMG